MTSDICICELCLPRYCLSKALIRHAPVLDVKLMQVFRTFPNGLCCRVLNRKHSDVFRTFGGSFSAVWIATIARLRAFCSVFQNVQDYATETEEFCSPSHQLSKCRQNFQYLIGNILRTFAFGGVQKALESCRCRKMRESWCVFGCKNRRRYSRERALQSYSIFFSFHPFRGFNFHRAAPPPLARAFLSSAPKGELHLLQCYLEF